ncbi:OPT oligopeptide transporter protein-domain-containing protein [Scheffersomyces coipomensis]|uniref:OPT oligopeptide transporter protein-domain-containing protein n=1 Tax=Scheffersomyces coipomensis TaxID=1788519 RepID=UPI00315DFA72
MTDSEKVNAITSITSVGSHLALEDHEIDLRAIASNPISIGDVGTTLTSDQKWFILRRLHFNHLLSLENLPIQATFMIEKIEALNFEEAIQILKEALIEHEDDINIPTPDLDLLENLVSLASTSSLPSTDIKEKLSYSIKEEKKDASTSSFDSPIQETKYDGDYHEIVDLDLQTRLEAALIAYHSPYPEVRSVTDPYDDPSIPVETVRVYIAGIIWTCAGAFINQFFSERQPSISLPASVVQILLYPTGILLAKILPKWKFTVWKYTVDLNPGPWSHKEQFLATLFYSVSGGVSYVSYNIHVQKMSVFYDNTWVDFGYETLLILSNNFLGFGLAGVMRKFAVYPVEAIWPTLLPTIALNKALMQPEKRENINGWTISKYYFFFISFAAMFIYFWIPNYLFQAISYFNWMTWIAPDNFNLAMITGSISGLGLNPIASFDWNVFDNNSGMIVPLYNQINFFVGAGIAFFCIVAVYWSNYKWTGYLPLNSNGLFTNTGEPYSVTAILNENGLLDEAKYQQIGPPFYSAANLVLYATVKALKGVYSGIVNYRKSTFEGFTDPHTTMMTAYPEVPDWAFIVILIISLVLAIICVEIYPAETPVWGLFFALGINFIFLIPITAVYARTGFSFGLNVLVELIVGYALPGNGLALNFIKAFGYNIDGQAQNYITDQKMAHYVKIPPRALFRAQIISVFITSFVQLGVLNFAISSIKNYCDPHNTQKFTCPGARTFYSASILWGVIGPKRVFNGLYPILQYCFLIGFLLAIPCLIFKKFGPKKLTKYFEPTLVIGGFLIYAPYNLTYYWGSLYLSIGFMWYAKNRYPAWWQKYNYILISGVHAGIAFSGLIQFFAVQYKEVDINWWGNIVSFSGIDAGYGRQFVVDPATAPDGYFGPRIGHFP